MDNVRAPPRAELIQKEQRLPQRFLKTPATAAAATSAPADTKKLRYRSPSSSKEYRLSPTVAVVDVNL